MIWKVVIDMLQNIQNMNDLSTLSYNDFKTIVDEYSNKNNVSFDTQMEMMVTNSLESKLNDLNINCSCPNCQSTIIVKNGKRKNGIQEYKCKECNKKFTRFTDTILEKTRWHWEIWLKVLEMTINNYSLEKMLNVLEQDYNCTNINIKTLWHWRLKLIHAVASLPQPNLTGVIRIDETFIRESQKGSRNLKSYINEERKARKGRKPSKYGVMWAEFATITTAIDNRGYSVCNVSCLGKLTTELFVDIFDKYLISPSYICTDANAIYNSYCGLNDILEFSKLKRNNDLNLARVNELHSEIKKFINISKTNVSTKYLNDYILFFNYLRNWKVRFGHFPSSKKDVEEIFKEILTQKINYKINEVKQQELELPQPTGKYMKMLKETTITMKTISNNEFRFNDEDNVSSFNKREYLLNIPQYKLYELARHYKIKKYRKLANWSIVSILTKEKDIDKTIYNIMLKDRINKQE